MSSISSAARDTAVEAKQRVSRHGGVALLAMLAPAIGFPLLLLIACRSERFAFLRSPSHWPIELGLIAVFGTVATLGGILDWRFHRSGETSVGKPEHRAHVLALVTGGLPLFVLMTLASVLSFPHRLFTLLPILLVVLYTATLICYDEFAFHTKRCDRFETVTHRMLVFGNMAAWLAWMHWLFARPAWEAI